MSKNTYVVHADRVNANRVKLRVNNIYVGYIHLGISLPHTPTNTTAVFPTRKSAIASVDRKLARGVAGIITHWVCGMRM